MESLSYDNKSSNNTEGSLHLKPTTSRPIYLNRQTLEDNKSTGEGSNSQRAYQVKCDLLEYHIHEATLINKALKSEVKQYQEKIDFEKKLKKFLVNRIKKTESLDYASQIVSIDRGPQR